MGLICSPLTAFLFLRSWNNLIPPGSQNPPPKPQRQSSVTLWVVQPWPTLKRRWLGARPYAGITHTCAWPSADALNQFGMPNRHQCNGSLYAENLNDWTDIYIMGTNPSSLILSLNSSLCLIRTHAPASNLPEESAVCQHLLHLFYHLQLEMGCVAASWGK